MRARAMHAGLAAFAGMTLLAATPALGAEPMPAAQQNALVRKYCAVCHTDRANNGGLSLEHFDAGSAAPSLAAMMLSKLTGGVPLETVRAISRDAGAAQFVRERVRSGAMNAAGIPQPDEATMDSLIRAFAAQSAGAAEWWVDRRGDGRRDAKVTASILREAPANENRAAEAYRLIVGCNAATGAGYLQLAWSPVARNGSVTVSVDGKAAKEYRVEGSETMGNGSGKVLEGLAALMLEETGRGGRGLGFPSESLLIRDLFPGESVTFPFAPLPAEAKRALRACFPGSI
ncbi:MAG: hypothetical protein R2762_18645 [Bryobacteraceae bacterium]